MHPVGPAHHDLVFEGIGLFFKYGQKIIQIGQQQVRGLGQAQAQGGVQHVGRRQAEVEVAAVLPQAGGHLVHERGHVVVGLGLDLQDAGHVDFGLAGGPLRRLRRYEAALRHGSHGGQFHLEPAGKLVLFGPDPGHDFTAVSGNHASPRGKISVLKSSSGGTGFPACADRLAGEDARPTNLFMFYGWAKGPCATAWKSSRRGGLRTAPTTALQSL